MKTKTLMALSITLAVIALAFTIWFVQPVESATQLSEQTALNRLERYQRPTGVNVYAADSDTAVTLTWTGSSSTVSVTVTGDTLMAYINGVKDATYFTDVDLSGKTIKETAYQEF